VVPKKGGKKRVRFCVNGLEGRLAGQEKREKRKKRKEKSKGIGAKEKTEKGPFREGKAANGTREKKREGVTTEKKGMHKRQRN